ncbi:collagen alpha-5(vi) chain [Plakobranchus ocellatus]|uniref:Collagen alpha-5(Vi) chain n=1 Tax=Plakobranchus ocellatus TaxID=259542 RepID=A0AAV4BVQ6_9GAST|nr:collagen alpha-5(vi) chain [Plakobranchus ocellatus]
MGESNFRLQLNSVSNMVNNLDVSPNNVHVGAILYSQEVESPVIQITTNKAACVQGIQSWPYPDTETRTDLAIEEAMDMFQRDARGGDVPQILIIVTDGASTIPAQTISAATEAKRRGIDVYAVGVAGARNEIDMDELRAVASSPDQVLVTPDFRTLETALNRAAEQICVSLECGQSQIDMVFMLDTSSTVGSVNFEQIKDYIIEFLYFAHIRVGNIRVGVMTFSDTPRMEFNMLSYVGNENGLNQAVRAIQYRAGGTNLGSALRFVREQMYTVANGDRQEAPDVVIMISGSMATIGQDRTVVEAEATRAAGIQVYGLGIGLPSTRDLDGITSRPLQQNRFTVANYDQLLSTIQPIYANFNRFCAACYMGMTDIWYVVDLSMNAERLSRFDYTNDFARLKNGITEQINIVLDPSVSNPGVRMGLVTFSDQAQRVVTPSDQASVSRTAQGINAIPGFVRVGGTNILSALQQITTPPQQSRWNSYVAIVTPQSAFNNNNFMQVQNEMNRLLQLGYTIVLFTVRDGSAIAPSQLAGSGSGPRYFYYLTDYQMLEEATKNFTRDILCAPPPPPRPTTRAPVTLPPRVNGLCAPSRYQQDGMDVVAHPTDCDKYVQCYWNPDTRMDLAILRTCPMGLHWLQSRRQCVPPREASCNTDICQEDCDPYKAEGVCGAYWECEGRRSEFKCCRPMFSFKEGKGCVLDPTCTAECQPKTWCGICMKRPSFRTLYGYDVMTTSSGNQGNQMFQNNQMTSQWSPRHCDYSYFDVVTCDCTMDMNSVCPADRSFNFRDAGLLQQIQAGQVDGIRVKDVETTSSGISLRPTSELHVDVNKGDKGDPFTMLLRFSEGQMFNPYGQVILTSGMNCGQKRGLVVNADNRFIIAQAYSKDGQKVVVSVPYQGIAPNEFKTLGISYAKGKLTLSVMGRNHQYIAQSKAKVDLCFSCGIDIGAALNKESIVSGQVESISVHSCDIQSFYI